jgi:hypothetical protein
LINFSMKVLNMTRHFKFISGLLALFCVLFLSGCSTLRVIESQVQTSTQWPTGATVPKEALFRWERLPADVNSAQAGWAEVELEAALKPLSWTRNDVDAQYSVWVGVRTAEFIADAWGRPVRGPWVNHLHFGIGSGYRPRGMSTNIGWSMGGPLYPAYVLAFRLPWPMPKRSASSFATSKLAKWFTKPRRRMTALGPTIPPSCAP